MKRVIPYLIIVSLCVGIFFAFYKKINSNFADFASDKIPWSIKAKGLKNAKDFVIDKDMNCYIAYSNKVQFIDRYGKSYILFQDNKLNISSMDIKEDVLYYASDISVYSYNIKTKEQKEIVNSLPNLGDYNKSKIFVKDNILYITIGSATNSGIVGEDNSWIKDNPYFHDMSPKNITVSSNISKNLSTGAFVPYNTKNISGQTIPAHSPGNSSVMAYNINTGAKSLYAWGIRNINGIDYNSEGKVFMSVGGMEDRGARPIKGDTDYVFELKEGTWYGWPDYSGGDPITSPKFKSGNSVKLGFLLDKHPTTNPPAPIYQHKNLSSITSLAVDKSGALGEKDSIYFYDSKDNTIYEITKSSVLKEFAKFKESSSIVSLKYIGKRFYILDSSRGYLSFVEKETESKPYNTSKNVYYYILGVLGIGIVLIVWKFKK